MAGVTGRSGRRPKPVALKKLAGNPGKRSLNTEAPDFGLVTNINCPEWMGDYGRSMWEHITPLLCRQHVLQATDIHVLEAFCNAYDQFRVAQKQVKKYGPIFSIKGRLVKNPAVTAVKEATATMAAYGGMLGLDPASRQRLVGKKPDTSGNPFTKLLNG